MKNIIVITPTERESAFFAEHGIRVLHCGVGMAECAAATARIICSRKPDMIILAGIAGTYFDDIEIGETVIVSSETIAGLGRYSCDEFTPLYRKIYITPVAVKGFRIVRSNTANTAGAVIAMPVPVEAEIENMEGAAFFAVCEQFGIPAMEVRTVSNRVGERIDGHNMDISINRLAIDLKKIIATFA